jgi:hypothetical protein
MGTDKVAKDLNADPSVKLFLSIMIKRQVKAAPKRGKQAIF